MGVTKKTKKSVKSTARKAVRKVGKIVYKVTAAYTGKFATAQAAKAAIAQLKASGKAQISPAKKVSGGYSFIVKLVFVTPSATVRNQAVKDAKARGARVTVSTLRA